MELSSPRDDARATLEAILAEGMDDGIVDDAVIAANLSQRAAFWKLRDEMSAAQKPEGGSIKHDISVPVAAVPDFIEEANAAVVKLIPGSRPVPFGHLGDGNIHYNVSQPVGGDTADFLAPLARGQRRRVRRSCCGWAARSPPSTASACSSATNCPRSRTRSRSS